MEPTLLNSAADLTVYAGIVVGLTQLVKEAGVQGIQLRVAAVLIGAALWAVMTYLPAVWLQVVALVAALSATGLVAFGDERLKKPAR